MLGAAPVSTAARLLDFVVPRAWRRRAIERAAGRYLERLLEVNSARVTNDFEARVFESRRQLEAELRARLQELVESAVRALESARPARAAGAAAIGAELERLERLRAQLSTARVEAA
jgi:ABC-type transport system involved in cytochrome bd biosynthesis fused ATPase/permease subunit